MIRLPTSAGPARALPLLIEIEPSLLDSKEPPLTATIVPTNPDRTADILTRDMVAIEDTWDLTPIYPSEAEWESDAARVPELIDTAAAHRGMLGESPMALLVALDDVMAVRQVVERLRNYAALRRDEDTTNPESTARY